MQEQRLNILLFCLLTLFWSLSYLAIKVTLEHFSPFFGAFLRASSSFLLLTLIFYFSRASFRLTKEPHQFHLYWRVWVAGFFSQTLPFITLFWGEQWIDAGMAGVINGTTPIWTFCLGILFLPSRVSSSALKILGLLLGFLGTVMIFWPTLHVQGSAMAGFFSVLVMAISYAIGALLNQVLFGKEVSISFQANIWHQHLVSVIVIGILCTFCHSWPSANALTSLSAWSAVIYLGFFSTAAAWLIYYHLIRSWDAVRASSVMYLTPPLALLWDAVISHIPPDPSEVYGTATVLLGVFLIQLTKDQWVSVIKKSFGQRS